jgi:hypothetical protein
MGRSPGIRCPSGIAPALITMSGGLRGCSGVLKRYGFAWFGAIKRVVYGVNYCVHRCVDSSELQLALTCCLT